jgi:hypothetical protein
MTSNSGDSSPSRAHVVAVRQMSCNWTLYQLSAQLQRYLLSASLAELNSTEQAAPVLFFITTLHGQQRKRRSSIVARVFVSAGTCLPILCLETAYCIAMAVVVVSKSLPSNGSIRHSITEMGYENGTWMERVRGRFHWRGMAQFEQETLRKKRPLCSATWQCMGNVVPILCYKYNLPTI